MNGKTIPMIENCEGIRGTGYDGDIAVDDIKLLPGPCQPTGTCDFEVDVCGYSNTRNGDNFDWLRSAGSTLTANTGPSVDHTTNTDQGFYMYIDATGRNKGERAWFYSQYFQPSPAACFTFWYYMYGANVGSLRLYKPDPSRTVMLWNATGNQGNIWRQAFVQINSSTAFQVTFDGEIGSGYLGDIAIDDVALHQGFCNNFTTIAPSTVTPMTTVSYPPTKYDCTFDSKNICQWTQDTTDQFSWTVHKGSTTSLDTGPTFDHTTNSINGYYIYIETSSKHPNDTARIISPMMSLSTSGQCLKFYYNMHGEDVYKLNLYARQGSSLGSVLWTKIGNQGNVWKYGSIYLTPQSLSPSASSTVNVQLVFEGVVGKSYKGDIALDDISVNDGLCPPSGKTYDNLWR
ncbi:hypothetical protein KUTeg_023884 [Tegillarca granosa]|uniref:MAM domain-containing protein n=1 Tax=Tegillarca granosa TaxID=220873 RepID=A0ABQ9E2Y1_TEGGR|nr:hypothetical protein KUTeg_023884 [Tegillarca granosa]